MFTRISYKAVALFGTSRCDVVQRYFLVCIPYAKSISEKFKCMGNQYNIRRKKNSVVLVRKRTIPTERPSHVGEVSANFCG
jgi:hypothetical protein